MADLIFMRRVLTAVTRKNSQSSCRRI